jgi:hypothetical protein
MTRSPADVAWDAERVPVETLHVGDTVRSTPDGTLGIVHERVPAQSPLQPVKVVVMYPSGWFVYRAGDLLHPERTEA